ncbi:MAG: M28 family peptidase [Pseudomonadota bacterium]
MQTFSIVPTTWRAWLGVCFRLTAFVFLPLGLILAYMLHVPGHSYRGKLAPLTSSEQALASQMFAHVMAVASTEHNTRHPDALERAAGYIESQLAGMNYPVALQQFDSIDTTMRAKVRNIEVEIKGSSKPQEIVIVGAHYDSAPGAPGANDNGSGTAMVLELARSLHTSAPQRTLRFVLFANEEPPYFGGSSMGSLKYANRSRSRGENIVAMLSLETIGYYDDAPNSQIYPSIFRPFFPNSGDFVGFVSDLHSRELMHRTITRFRATEPFPSEGVAAFAWIQGVDWSDHGSFWKNGYPAIMVTDTAIFRYPYYHTGSDTPDRLNYGRMAKVFNGVRAAVAELAGAAK